MQISQLIESNEDLQEKLVLLKKAYDKLEKQASEWQTDIVSLQSSILEEYESKSLLKDEIQQISSEKLQLENDLFEFNQLLEDMKMVATESEIKDDEIMKLEIKLQDSKEQILALEAQIFKKEQDSVEFQQEFQDLQDKYDECMVQLESLSKEVLKIIFNLDFYSRNSNTSSLHGVNLYSNGC